MKYSGLFGWFGVGLILVAYFLVSFELILPKDIIYISMNILGSAGIIVSSFKKKDMQPVVLNIIWLLVAIISLIRAVTS